MINTIKALAGLALLAGVVYAIFFFSMAGRMSPDEATLAQFLRLGTDLGRMENNLGNPVASFSSTERAGLDQWLTPYPVLQDYVKNKLKGWQIARAYAYDQGYAQALVLTYSLPSASANGSSTPLLGYALLVRDPPKIVSEPNN